MKKKGGGHLEIVLAFSIFLTAVIFLFIYIRPFETNTLSEVALISLKNSFEKNAGTSLFVVYVNGSLGRCAPQDFPQNWIYKNISGKNTDYYVYFSEEFLGDSGRCDSSKINVGSVISRKIISNRSIIQMQEKYHSNYSGLKIDLGIPTTIDFEIYTLDGKYNLTRGVKEEIEIIARRNLLPVLNSNGKIINREFVFRIW